MNPIKDWRKLSSLKFSGNCCECGLKVAAGSASLWSPSTSKIRCLSCGQPEKNDRPEPNSQNHEGSVEVFDDNAELSEWQRWIQYCIDCVETQNVDREYTKYDSKRLHPLPNYDSKLVDLRKELQETTKQFLGQVEASVNVLLGWPTIALERNQVVPVFTTPIDLGETSGLNELSLSETELDLSPHFLQSFKDQTDVIEALSSTHLNLDSQFTAEKAGQFISKVIENLQINFGDQVENLSDLVAGKICFQPALYVSEIAPYHRNLLLELRTIRDRNDWQNSALGEIFTPKPTVHRSCEMQFVVAPLPLNESQQRAVEATAKDKITVITGPPGTGKSQIISALVAQAWTFQQTMLLASTNNSAVDVAIERVNSENLLILRSGNNSYREKLRENFSKIRDDVDKRPKVTNFEQGQLATVQRELLSIYTTRQSKFNQHQIATDAKAELSKITESVIPFRIELFETDTRQYFSESYQWIVRTLQKYFQGSQFFLIRLWRKHKLVSVLGTDLGLSPELIHWAKLEQDVLSAQTKFNKVRRQEIAGEQIEKMDQQWLNLSKDFLCQHFDISCRSNKKIITKLMQRLDQKGDISQSQELERKIFPAWAVSSLSVKSTVPLKAGSVDLVVIDEATQCSLVDIIPLAYRAKRLLVMGDANQLPPILKMTELRDREIAESNGLKLEDLRERGIHHFKNSAFLAFEQLVEDTYLLDEHYRSHATIAKWFNSYFYRGNLDLLGSRPPQGYEQGIVGAPVFGQETSGDFGSRINRQEANKSAQLVEQYSTMSNSIGVVTPYKEQARLINSLVRRNLSSDVLGRINFMSGTAHTFQGNERDIMLYSTVLTPDSPNKAAEWIRQNRNLINVAVSRARELLVIVGHPDLGTHHRLPEITSLWDLANGQIDFEGALAQNQTQAEKSLMIALHDLGKLAIPQFVVGGLTVDLALPVDSVRGLAIEVDGPSHFDSRKRRVRSDYQRDKILNDLGWKVIRIGNWEVYDNPIQAAQRCLDYLGEITG